MVVSIDSLVLCDDAIIVVANIASLCLAVIPRAMILGNTPHFAIAMRSIHAKERFCPLFSASLVVWSYTSVRCAFVRTMLHCAITQGTYWDSCVQVLLTAVAIVSQDESDALAGYTLLMRGFSFVSTAVGPIRLSHMDVLPWRCTDFCEVLLLLF